MTGIEQAVYAVGSQASLAKLIGCSQQNVGRWVAQGYCPAERVVEVEQASGVDRKLLVNPRLIDLLTPTSL